VVVCGGDEGDEDDEEDVDVAVPDEDDVVGAVGADWGVVVVTVAGVEVGVAVVVEGASAGLGMSFGTSPAA
jgi:hypothetical protein